MTVVGTVQGEVFNNVYHFIRKDFAEISASDLTALSAILDDAATDDDSAGALYRLMDSGLAISQLRFRGMGAPNFPFLNTSVSFAGTSSGNDVSAALAVVLSWQTGLGGGSNRGRTYIPGLNVGFVQTAAPSRLDTTWAATQLTEAQNWLNAWAGNATYSFAVFSPTNGDFQAITAVTINPIVGVQRRRRPRV